MGQAKPSEPKALSFKRCCRQDPLTVMSWGEEGENLSIAQTLETRDFF